MNEEERELLQDDLAKLVHARYMLAVDANSDHHRRALDCAKQVQGTLFPPKGDEVGAESVSMNITLPIVEQLTAMFMEVFDSVADQPFTLVPSPIAELPDDKYIELENALRNNIDQLIPLAEGDPQKVTDIVTTLVRTTLELMNEEAVKAADSATAVVNDRLKEGSFSSAFSEFVRDFTCYPTAVISGPLTVMENVRVWSGGTLTYEPRQVRYTKTVPMFNIFPAPGARDFDTCDYVIERVRYTATELMDMNGISGFDSDALSRVLKEDSSIISYGWMGNNDPETELASVGDQSTFGMFDTLIYKGRIHGEMLAEHGVDVAEKRIFYEAEIWVVGDCTIKAVLNTDPLNRRGYFGCSYQPVAGTVWGKSAVEIIRDAQRQCTTAGRALARNMGFSSGPIGEVFARNLVDDGADPTELYPLMIREVKNVGKGPTYRFQLVPSLANELWTVFAQHHALAFELLGVPKIAFGSTEGQATLGRTSGGLGMMVTQAYKPIRSKIANIEKKVVEPLIQRYVDFEMIFNPAMYIKGDVKVAAKGVSGLLEKEQQGDNLSWVLQSIGPYAQIIPQEVILRIIIALLERAGVSTKGLPNFDLQDALSSDLQGNDGLTSLQQDPNVEPLVDTSGLDGRSQNAINVINSTGGGGV